MTSDFRGGWGGQAKWDKTGQGGEGSLEKIGHPIFWNSCHLLFKIFCTSFQKWVDPETNLPPFTLKKYSDTHFETITLLLTQIVFFCQKCFKFCRPPLKGGGGV